MDTSRQKLHYANMHDEYEAHYYDETSMRYRSRFIYRWLFRGADLNGTRVADLACGSGYNSLALLDRFPNAQTVGFDISEPACAAYTELTGRNAHCVDLTKPLPTAEMFDHAMVVGGLHHCLADLPQTLRNVASLLRPGGYLFMMEPSAEFFLNAIRDVWYRRDRFFDESNEQALSHDDLFQAADGYFENPEIKYFGGPAYFLILNSLVTRVSLRAKPLVWTLMSPLEAGLSWLPLRSVYPCFLARWQRSTRPVYE